MASARRPSVGRAALALALGVSPRLGYALSDTIVTDVLKVLAFGVAGLVVVGASLLAILALATGRRKTSKASALVAVVALLAGLLCLPDFSSSHYESPEERLERAPHPFGLVSTPGRADSLTPVPPLRTDTAVSPQLTYHRVYTYVPDMPQLPGGNTEAIELVRQNLRYPVAARAHHTTGLVLVRFLVTEEGQVVHACVLKSLGDGCDEEALRIVRGLPRFSNGRQVPTELRCYFSFRPPEAPGPRTD